MNAKTIDERLRKAARDRLSAEIAGDMEAIRKRCRTGETIFTNVKEGASALGCLDAVFKSLMNHYAERCEEKAVADFLKKVDELSEEVEDLRNSVGSSIRGL